MYSHVHGSFQGWLGAGRARRSLSVIQSLKNACRGHIGHFRDIGPERDQKCISRRENGPETAIFRIKSDVRRT